MADFFIYKPKLEKWEGKKFVADPADYGGATNRGVTLETFRMIFGETKTVADLKNMTDQQWLAIMKGYFWDKKCHAGEINNQSVAEIFVDWCINSGVAKIKMVQSFVGVTADGIVGKVTIAAINSANQENLHRRIKLARAQRYMDQLASDRSQMKYFNGWFNRLIDFNYKK